uniref:Uncharacterized protein n=1 Tax=Pseudonaja textilis TaxID=8673 RepID=A0A670XN21_PSETE
MRPAGHGLDKPEAAAVQCPVRAALNHLCQELNLDVDSASAALRDFTALRGTYSLEGDVIHWLACALYVACRRSVVPTVGSSLMKGNCVSLTRILRSAKLRYFCFKQYSLCHSSLKVQ